ncbi:hypothetical protein FIBSPDRAFT_958085 [Athelia psychrophila]|uniref:DEAD/DEAH box helicase domain-containing protein n=1 Tax=Athelia psychrophila TaxID=1759441 RepID=A0A166F2F3_9AGAM|nr:hypothetical protein FIBSPDRAFT_960189 [Fibularhizoctonia sp. CBS 109695]KZP16363.1 hypothetical protein FIBSPDRAFT_958085 [Fibularhizoctonia sp. CBS 109695]
MSENIPPINTPPTQSRKCVCDAPLTLILQSVLVFHDDIVPPIPATPKNTTITPYHLSRSTKATKQWRNGFEKPPKPLGYIPYATPKRQSQTQHNLFNTEHTMVLEPMDPLAAPEWNLLARRMSLLPESATLHEFQMQAVNLVLERTDDLMVIAPTGKGKSLLWSLL